MLVEPRHWLFLPKDTHSNLVLFEQIKLQQAVLGILPFIQLSVVLDLLLSTLYLVSLVSCIKATLSDPRQLRVEQELGQLMPSDVANVDAEVLVIMSVLCQLASLSSVLKKSTQTVSLLPKRLKVQSLLRTLHLVLTTKFKVFLIIVYLLSRLQYGWVDRNALLPLKSDITSHIIFWLFFP